MTTTPAGFYRRVKLIRAVLATSDEQVVRLFKKYHSVGIVDTIKLLLPRKAGERDYKKIVENTKRWKTDFFKQTGEHRISIDRDTGLRVMFRKKCIIVEASIPRLIGLPSNERVCGITSKQVEQLITSITAELFPITTSAARLHGTDWRCTRIDCALDFFPSMKWMKQLEALTDLKWKRTRDEARSYNNDRDTVRGIMFGREGKRNPTARFNIYYKATERVNAIRKLKSRSKKNEAILPTANHYRVELQTRGFHTLDRVCKLFPSGTSFFIGLGKKRRGVALDYPAMHKLLFLSLLELSPLTKNDVVAYAAHRQLLELTYPGMYEALDKIVG